MSERWRFGRWRSPAGDAARHGRRGRKAYVAWERTGDPAHLDTAEGELRAAIDTAPDDPDRHEYLANLGYVLGTRYALNGDLEDIDEAIDLIDEAVDIAPADHPDRPGHLSGLGNALRSRHDHDGRPEDLDEAVEVSRSAVAAAPEGHRGRALFLSNLAVALRTRFEAHGDDDDREAALAAARAAVEQGRDRDPGVHSYLSNLSAMALAEYDRTGRPADLEEALAMGRESLARTPEAHPDRPRYLINYAAALMASFEASSRSADLDEAVPYIERAIAMTPGDHPNRPTYVASLAKLRLLAFERDGDPADLEDAVAGLDDAVAAVPDGHPDRLKLRTRLAGALGALFEHTGEQHVLDEAVGLARDSLAATPADDPFHDGRSSVLGELLRHRYLRTGAPADLDEAVAAGRAAVGGNTAGDDDPAALANLGIALWARYDLTGQPDDLDEGLTRLREAVDVTPPGHVDRPVHQSNLGAVLASRYERSGLPSDLDMAIAHLEDAVDGSPATDPSRSLRLLNLANTLRARYELTEELADLDAAIGRLEEAVATVPADNPNRPACLGALAVGLLDRFELSARPADLDEAARHVEEALAATPADHPNGAQLLLNLAGVLLVRGRVADEPADRRHAVDALRGAATTPTAPPALRLAAARAWGREAGQDGDAPAALAAYTTAVEVLPALVWHGLARATRKEHLREWAGLAVEAAGAAVRAGEPQRAVELLEAGRSVLWTQTLNLRHDLAALRDRAPELAEALTAAGAVLEGRTPADGGIAGGFGPRADQEDLERRRRAARDWDAALTQIRGLAGFAHFLRPVPFAELRAAAADGPVVVVVVGEDGGHALVLTPGSSGVAVVELPEADEDQVHERVEALRTAQERAVGAGLDRATADRDRLAVFDVLAWTWRAITEPVLLHLGIGPAAGERPRVWWCPTGLALLLPLHAAGRHLRSPTRSPATAQRPPDADTVAGRVVSSYTPTLSALIRARERRPDGPPVRLAVGLPDPPRHAPSAGPLPGVTAELAVLAGSPPHRTTTLVGAAATRGATLDALPRHSWLHLSCHGVQHDTDPDLSAFLLHDRPLTLADIAALELPAADLAYLAACQTATGDVGLPDEFLHLAAGLALVGFRHVLATMWTISDEAAPMLARTAYAALATSGVPNSAPAAHALHEAVEQLRRTWPADPLLWAPYVHFGP